MLLPSVGMSSSDVLVHRTDENPDKPYRVLDALTGSIIYLDYDPTVIEDVSLVVEAGVPDPVVEEIPAVPLTPSDDLEALTVAELKDVAAGYDLPVSGTKQVILDRIIDYLEGQE